VLIPTRSHLVLDRPKGGTINTNDVSITRLIVPARRVPI
jgi:hypothetical protein